MSFQLGDGVAAPADTMDNASSAKIKSNRFPTADFSEKCPGPEVAALVGGHCVGLDSDMEAELQALKEHNDLLRTERDSLKEK